MTARDVKSREMFQELRKANLRADEAEERLESLAVHVRKFFAERDDFIRAIHACPSDNIDDYYRWQGHAEARRLFRELLDRKGVSLFPARTPVVGPVKAADVEQCEGQQELPLGVPS